MYTVYNTSAAQAMYTVYKVQHKLNDACIADGHMADVPNNSCWESLHDFVCRRNMLFWQVPNHPEVAVGIVAVNPGRAWA